MMLSSGITTSAALANAFSGDYLSALVELPVAPVSSVIEVSGLVLVIVVAAIVFGSGQGDPGRSSPRRRTNRYLVVGSVLFVAARFGRSRLDDKV